MSVLFVVEFIRAIYGRLTDKMSIVLVLQRLFLQLYVFVSAKKVNKVDFLTTTKTTKSYDFVFYDFNVVILLYHFVCFHFHSILMYSVVFCFEFSCLLLSDCRRVVHIYTNV